MQFQHEFVLSLLLTCNTTEISNRNEKKKDIENSSSLFLRKVFENLSGPIILSAACTL